MSMKANLNCSIVIGSWSTVGNTIHQARILKKNDAESKQISTHVFILFSVVYAEGSYLDCPCTTMACSRISSQMNPFILYEFIYLFIYLFIHPLVRDVITEREMKVEYLWVYCQVSTLTLWTNPCGLRLLLPDPRQCNVYEGSVSFIFSQYARWLLSLFLQVGIIIKHSSTIKSVITSKFFIA